MPARHSFDPLPNRETYSTEGAVLVAHLVIDEFRRRDVSQPREGEDWFWKLDANEVPQYTTMEALVRDIVDIVATFGVPAMRRGSLWWVRSLHVHPRCRGRQLGGRLFGRALAELVKGPCDLAVLEAHPEPTMFAPSGEFAPGSADWNAYERPSRTAEDGLVRYFSRMGFLRPDTEESGIMSRSLPPRSDDPTDEVSRTLGIVEHGPDAPDAAVAMFAFLGDLHFKNGPRLGRVVWQATVGM
jgi:GNAT superfamily N-acetyltransferase